MPVGQRRPRHERNIEVHRYRPLYPAEHRFGCATPEERRIELRTVDATCNPYPAYAGMLIAGIDGIKRNLNAKKLGFGPYNQDLYNLSIEETEEIAQAPTDLGEALSALKEDHDYLTVGGVFEEEEIVHWIKVKREEQS